MRHTIHDEYYNWLLGLVRKRLASFEKLLTRLHNTDFGWLLARDANRAADGVDLRRKFAMANGYEDEVIEVTDILDEPCSVLEMMIALSIRMENFMDDPAIGDRTKQWFWGMVVSLGLGSMTDSHYDEQRVDDILDRFMRRDYEPNGNGGLFRLRHPRSDLRDEEIWTQMCWYLDELYE